MAHVQSINLPHQSTPFIGREQELDDLTTLLCNPDCRLLTLVGSGGMGKTRLALEAVHQVIIREQSDSARIFTNGIYFIALQPINSPELIVSAIAEAIGFSFRGQQDPIAQLLEYLHDRQLLLILDNFEHLLEGADLIAEILQAAPDVQLLVTSREILNLQKEWVRKVRGMRFPDNDQIEDVETYSAMKLFIERARQVRGNFSIEKEQACIIRLCQLVDGMPLAIELAVAWLKRLPCTEVATEIERNLDFLTTRLRDVPERHRSMRAVFEQSWNLLEQDEHEVFKQCAIFRAGFRREAAEAVAGASLFTLSSLVDKSMLRVTPTGRYEIHELLRQYAEEKLDETSGAKDATYDRHCDYYADYLHQRQDNSRNAQQVVFLEEIGADIENARIAWDWAITHEKWEAIGRMLDSLERFYVEKSWYLQADHAFDVAGRALRCDNPTGLRAHVFGHILARQGIIFLFLGQYEKAMQVSQESLLILRDLNALDETFYPLRTIALCAQKLGKFDEGKEWAQQAYLVAQDNDDHWGMAMALGTMTFSFQAVSNNAECKKLLQEGIKIFRQIGDVWGVAWLLFQLSDLYLDSGKFEEARRLSVEGLMLAQESNSQQITLFALLALGNANHALGAYEEAKRNYHAHFQIISEAGSFGARASSLLGLGQVALAQKDYEEAQRLFEQYLTANDTPPAYALHQQARLFYALGKFEQAKTIYLKCLEKYKDDGWIWGTAHILNNLGTVCVTLNRVHDSQQYFQEALQVGLGIGLYPLVLGTFVGSAQLFATQGNREQAVELLALALHHSACHADTKISATRLLNLLETELSSEIYSVAFERGMANNLESIAVSLLETLSRPQTDRKWMSSRSINQSLVDPLSERELGVLRLVAREFTNPAIAESLTIALTTVKTHVRHILRKLDATNRHDAVDRAKELGLL
jgi:predicted ATPase/DNA-binding NarL/FixJ family response regulator